MTRVHPRPPEVIYLPHKNFEWNPERFNILGVNFTISLTNITDENIDEKYYKLQEVFKKWKSHKLTPLGKVTVLRSLIISQIIHILISLPSPSQQMIKKREKIMFDFLWEGKPDKIKRTVAFRKLEFGGLNMLDLKKLYHCVKVYMDTTNEY